MTEVLRNGSLSSDNHTGVAGDGWFLACLFQQSMWRSSAPWVLGWHLVVSLCLEAASSSVRASVAALRVRSSLPEVFLTSCPWWRHVIQSPSCDPWDKSWPCEAKEIVHFLLKVLQWQYISNFQAVGDDFETSLWCACTKVQQNTTAAEVEVGEGFCLVFIYTTFFQ